MTTDRDSLGPAETIINTLLTHQDHLYHGRPGIVIPDVGRTPPVRWEPVTTTRDAIDHTVSVFALKKQGKRTIAAAKFGRVVTHPQLDTGRVTRYHAVVGDRDAAVGEYREAGLFPEVAAWFYRQIAAVWQLDNEFAARWASHAFAQEHRDLKVVLAAFMLCQSRKGDPVRDAGKVAFFDADYRDVGEAMALITPPTSAPKGKSKSDKLLHSYVVHGTKLDDHSLSPKHLLRIHELLVLPQIAAINRELGFTTSTRSAFLGRWPTAVDKWLRYREENPALLAGLVKAGFRTTVIALARRVGYKPTSAKFFAMLRWKQAQTVQGHRTIAIGTAVKAAESWAQLTEAQICARIVKSKPDWKRIVGLLPAEVGVTRAVVAAAMTAGALSAKDLVILTPTLEALGLLALPEWRAPWEAACKAATDTRAANIARNVESQVLREQLHQAADVAVQKEVAKAIEERPLRIYFLVDISSSMMTSIEAAKGVLGPLVQAFPLDRVHVAVFNTAGREVKIAHASTAGVTNAFVGIRASGGTDYGAGVHTLRVHPPKADEDALMIFVGDEEATMFDTHVRASGLRPTAFGLVKLGGLRNDCVRATAQRLGIPCVMLDAAMFADPYAAPRLLRNLVAATPIGAALRPLATPRRSLVDVILDTPLLAKPTWA